MLDADDFNDSPDIGVISEKDRMGLDKSIFCETEKPPPKFIIDARDKSRPPM